MGDRVCFLECVLGWQCGGWTGRREAGWEVLGQSEGGVVTKLRTKIVPRGCRGARGSSGGVRTLGECLESIDSVGEGPDE